MHGKDSGVHGNYSDIRDKYCYNIYAWQRQARPMSSRMVMQDKDSQYRRVCDEESNSVIKYR